MKRYRKDIESGQKDQSRELHHDPGPGSDTLSEILNVTGKEMNASRRDFLKLCGFSLAAVTLASCKSRISKAIPYIIAPVEITPGQPLLYASSYMNGSDYCSVIVRTRDGRPIKIEGNPLSAMTRGGTTARVQASVLDLYDSARFICPLKDGTPVEWSLADEEIISGLNKIVSEKGSIVLLTPTVYSPSTEAVIEGFLKKFPGSEWVMYDAISASGMLEANKASFGRQAIPDFRFEKADVIVSFGADFLGTWLSPVEYTKQFASRRDPEKDMNFLVQIESGLSLTGCNADRRIQAKPSQEYSILLNIYSEIVLAAGGTDIKAPPCPVDVKWIVQKLVSAKGRSLVISGSNAVNNQLLVNEINTLLGNIGNTILFDSFLRTRRAIDSQMENLVERMAGGRVGALIVWNSNPAYTWYDRNAFTEALKKVELTVSISGTPDETNELVKYICPDNHYLESWNDAEPKKDLFSLMQPAIRPVFNTRQMAESILKWTGSSVEYYDFIKTYWSGRMMTRQKEYSDPVLFFDNTLQKGVFEPDDKIASPLSASNKPESSNFNASLEPVGNGGSESEFEVVLYEPVAMGEGRQANNPWLQELPDPVARICWDNFASVSVKQANENNLAEGDVIELDVLNLPVHLQPGQAYGTVSLALGYGRRRCGVVGEGVGIDVTQLASFENGTVMYSGRAVNILKKDDKYILARTQTHHSMEGRALVREAGLDEFKNNPAAGNELHEYFKGEERNLYPEREYPHHHWGMAVDLSKCTGCGNCVVACQAENNIPVVGKEEVYRVHEMHWMRIDRYFSGDDMDPEVVFQPVLCQHCQNAPCENVCPVAATNHSSEGLNQMIYNRCFGTRYCNNNCPYKVRRFNWFNYTEAGTLGGNLRDAAGMTGDLRRMVLNPDVTVRAQGVIEKCSFCIQRIQAAKLKAKTEDRALMRDEIKTACSQSCPADAIIFGDMNDTESELFRLIGSGRRYRLLEELYTRPSVNYLTKIRNRIS